MAQTKAQLVVGLDVNASAPASALQIDASGNVNLDSNTLYVDATNNRVGIGNSSPSSLLHLSVATAASDGTKGVRITNPAGTAAMFECGSSNDSYVGTTSGSDFSIRTNNTSRIYVTNGGNVGIGTASPGELLHIVNPSTTAEIRMSGGSTSAAYSQIGFYGGATRNAEIAANSAFLTLDHSNSGVVRIVTGGSEALRVDTSRRLLVGTSSSLATYLTQINFAGASTNGLYINSSSTSGDGSTMLALARASTPNNTVPVINYVDATAGRFELRNNGGLANYQANNVNLSDINTKKDISPAAGTWDCIKEWEIVNYRYKDQPDDADLNLGVIAQQVAESCPEVITVFQEAKEATEDRPAQEERLGIKEQQMYWMAIKALQEAQVRIEQLEAKVAALESA